MDILQNRNTTDITVVQVIDKWISYRTEMPQISVIQGVIDKWISYRTEMPQISQLYRG